MERKKLSANFYADEFQCPCCGKNNINPVLISYLQKMRIMFRKPMIITSGTRCQEHNKAVGGKPHSDHLLGFAADVHCDDSTIRRELVQCGLVVDIPTMGIKKDCIHFSIGFPARIFTYD